MSDAPRTVEYVKDAPPRVFDDPSRAVRALAALVAWRRRRERARPPAADAAASGERVDRPADGL